MTYQPPRMNQAPAVSPEQQAFEAGLMVAQTVDGMLANQQSRPVDPNKPQAGTIAEMTVVRATDRHQDVSMAPHVTVSKMVDAQGYTKYTMSKHRELMPGLSKRMSEQRVTRTFVLGPDGVPVMFTQEGGDWATGGDLPNRPVKSGPVAVQPFVQPAEFRDAATSTLNEIVTMTRSNEQGSFIHASEMTGRNEKRSKFWRAVGRVATFRAARQGRRHY